MAAHAQRRNRVPSDNDMFASLAGYLNMSREAFPCSTPDCSTIFGHPQLSGCMSGCPFKHPAVTKLLVAAALSVVSGVFRAATTQYRKLIRLHTLSRITKTT